MPDSPIAAPESRRALIAGAHRVVVKVGSSVLTRDDGTLATGRLHSLVRSLAALRDQGCEVVLVSSGAVRSGRARLATLPSAGPARRQVTAAVGQARLTALYTAMLARLGITAGQLLLSPLDCAHEPEDVRATLVGLLEAGAVPVVNENDAAMPASGRPARGAAFRDNDQLAALLAGLLAADLMVLLTDVNGLHHTDPRDAECADPIAVVDAVTPALVRAAGGARIGTGGMRSKVQAARAAARAGCATVIADGRDPAILERLFAAEPLGTLFLPEAGSMRNARRVARTGTDGSAAD